MNYYRITIWALLILFLIGFWAKTVQLSTQMFTEDVSIVIGNIEYQ